MKRHPDDNHGGLEKGHMAQKYFEQTVKYNRPDWKLVKTGRFKDVRGLDYELSKGDEKKTYAFTSCWEYPLCLDFLRVAVGVLHSNTVHHLFNSKAEYHAYYSNDRKNKIRVVKTEILRDFVLSNYGPIEKIKKTSDARLASETGMIRTRMRETYGIIDLNLYIPLVKILPIFAEIDIPEGVIEGVTVDEDTEI